MKESMKETKDKQNQLLLGDSPTKDFIKDFERHDADLMRPSVRLQNIRPIGSDYIKKQEAADKLETQVVNQSKNQKKKEAVKITTLPVASTKKPIIIQK